MVCPEYTKTDFTDHQGTSTVQEAGERIAKYAVIDQDGPTGKFISEEYFPAPASCLGKNTASLTMLLCI